MEQRQPNKTEQGFFVLPCGILYHMASCKNYKTGELDGDSNCSETGWTSESG